MEHPGLDKPMKSSKARVEHQARGLPSPTVMRSGTLAKSTELSPSLFPIKGSIAKYQKLPREQQVAVITEAKKVIKKLDNGLLAGSVRELWSSNQGPGSSGGSGTTYNRDAVASPPMRRKKKFVASPSPEPLRGKPHHPMRDGLRSSRALAGVVAGEVKQVCAQRGSGAGAIA